MKKTLLLMAIALPLGLMLPTSCTEKGKAVPNEETEKQAEASATANDNEAKVEDDTKAEARAEATDADGLVLTRQGVGPVKMGVNINKLPEMFNGLYNYKSVKVERNDMDGDMKFLKLYLSGTLMAKAMVDEKNCICSIEVMSKKIKTTDGLYPGMPVKHLLAKNVSFTYYPDGQLFAEDDNYYYNLDSSELSAAGEQRAYASSTLGKTSDFKPTATVKSISIKSEDF